MALLRSHTEAFGLDLSDGVVRAVQFSSQRRGLAVTAFAEQSLPTGIIVKGEPQEPKSLAEAIKSLLVKPRFGRFTSRRVVVSLPDSRTFSKIIEVPNTDGTQTQAAIQDEVSQYLPYSIEELYLDWKPFGVFRGLDKIRVLINAVPKAIADTYGTALEDADLKPIAFIAEPSAIAYAMTNHADLAATARLIIDLNELRTTYIVVDHDAVTFSTTNHDISGNSVTNMIVTSLQITSTEAEEAKRLCGLDPTRGRAALPTILQPFIEQLSCDIKRILEYYGSHSPTNTPIAEIVLTGTGADMRLLTNHLSEMLEQKVVIGNPWAKAGNIKLNGLASYKLIQALPAVIGLGLIAQSSKISEV
ncbi:MAG: type IV pilus assembly protein PilM [Patescibacteria group bacterium]|jgi:type IV pilus assembly protein PilM